MTGCIYLIRNMVNGKGYVGQTVRVAVERLREHVRDSRSGKTRMALHKAIRKYGEENFIVVEIAFAEEGVLLNELERHYINEFSTLTSQNGYNISEGGKGRASGFTVSDETRRKQSIARKGKKFSPESIERQHAPLRGRKRPAHVVEAIRAAHLGSKHSPEHNEKVAAAKRGTKSTPETRATLSALLMGNKRSVGRIHSDEVRKKMSDSHKANPVTYWKGKKLSGETRSKMSLAHTNTMKKKEVKP